MTQKERTQLKKKCDLAFSKFIRARDGHCLNCGKREPLDAAHIISRKFMATRYDPANCIALCKGCHLWWHAEPVLASRWLESRWPGRFDNLDFKRRSVMRIDLQAAYLMIQADYTQLQQKNA